MAYNSAAAETQVLNYRPMKLPSLGRSAEQARLRRSLPLPRQESRRVASSALIGGDRSLTSTSYSGAEPPYRHTAPSSISLRLSWSLACWRYLNGIMCFVRGLPKFLVPKVSLTRGFGVAFGATGQPFNFPCFFVPFPIRHFWRLTYSNPSVTRSVAK